MKTAALAAVFLILASQFREAGAERLVPLADGFRWPHVSSLISYDGRLWFANSRKYVNHNSADIWSYDVRTGDARYERHLFSQDAGDPAVHGGLLYWPFEDSRFSPGRGEFMVTDGRAWRWIMLPEGRAFHLHAMASGRDVLYAAPSAWTAKLQSSDDGGAHWRMLYEHPTPDGRVSRITALAAFDGADEKRMENPVWHIHNGQPPQPGTKLSFAMLLNLASVCNTEDPAVLWGFISRYAPGVTAETHPKLDELVGYAIRYFDDFVKPSKTFRAPDDTERDALAKLAAAFDALPSDADGGAIQDAALDVARGFERYQDPSKTGPDGGPAVTGDWFQMLYQVLLGQQRGPRFGSFVALYGLGETVALINKALSGELVTEAA
mgnify:CR=1 FL=1